MEFKGTKGPWRIMRIAGTSIESESGRFVATSGSFQDGTEKSHLENEANAKIISACHEMLEACMATFEAQTNKEVEAAKKLCRIAMSKAL